MSGSLQGAIGRTIFKLAFEVSPIILTGGIASQIPGGMLPLIVLTEGANLVTGLIAGGSLSLDDFFAHYAPLSGSSLIENEFAHYPFANQAVAANAIIRQPLRVSLLMHCPVRHAGGNLSRLLTFTTMKTALDAHHARGGTYTIATPSYIYQNCLLAALRDVTQSRGSNVQDAWQWDFEQPLLTLAQAAQAQNDQMSKLGTNGTPSSASASSLGNTVGGSASAVAPTVVPTAATPGGSVASPSIPLSTPTGASTV